MLINILWLIILLSFEATLGLPLFFLYLASQLLDRHGERVALFGCFALGLLLSIFYGVSWPLVSVTLLVWYVAKTFLVDRHLWLLLLYVAWQASFFFLADLNWHYFYLVHVAVFTWYFFRKNLRK